METLGQAGLCIESMREEQHDSCIRFLNEDPWERLRQIRAAVKDTKIANVITWTNLLGYRNYTDDINVYS